MTAKPDRLNRALRTTTGSASQPSLTILSTSRRAIRQLDDVPLESARLQAQRDTLVDRLSHVHHEAAVLLGERELCAAGIGE